MGRRQNDSDFGKFTLLFLFLIATISCSTVYLFLTIIFRVNTDSISSMRQVVVDDLGSGEEEQCCKGIQHLELWGDAVNWGAEFRVNSSEDCCMACKKICGHGDDKGSCLCNSWVYCGDRNACGTRFGECWLKKQEDALQPDRRDSGNQVMWTSGFVFDEREGTVGLETDYGILRIKLLPECAPHSVSYILELLALPHCVGCHIYRAESRGIFWDAKGNHIEKAPVGPPFALVQGTLESYGTMFKDIPKENTRPIRRGSVAWVGSGPEFFISLANHNEWTSSYTVFGYVLSQDMTILEKIASFPTKPEVWSDINVSILDKPVSLRFRRINTMS